MRPRSHVVPALFACIGACAPHTSISPRPGTGLETISVDVAEGSGLSVDVSPVDGSIVFDLYGQLWRVAAAGGQARALTDAVRDTAEDLDPSVSPDGRQVVFSGERGGRTGLWLLDLGTGAVRQLTQYPAPGALEGGAAWSPDGRAIAFSRVVVPDSGGRPRSTIAVLELASGSTRELHIEGLPRPDVFAPAWSPDGAHIAFVASHLMSRAPGRIWQVGAQGGLATPLTADSVRGLGPAFAPDGGRIAFLSADSLGRSQLWVQRPGAHEPAMPVQLTSHAELAGTRVRWSRAGTQLVYSADGKLWSVRAAGGAPRAIPFTAHLSLTRPRRDLPDAHLPEPGVPRPARAFMGLALSPDARTIGAIALGKLWLVPVGGAARVLADVPTTARYLAWSADGGEVAWSAGPAGHLDIFATRTSSGSTRQVTALDGSELYPTFSPDGSKLAFIHQDSATVLRVIDAHGAAVADTAATRNLGPASVDWTGSSIAPPQWSPGGDALLLDGDWRQGHATPGTLVTLAGESRTVLLPEAANYTQWRGDALLYARHDRLWRTAFGRAGSTGQPQPLGDSPAMYLSSAVDGSLLFVSDDGLRLRDAAGAERHLGWPVRYTPPVAPTLLIRNVRIIDGTGAATTAPSDILVERGRIASITPAGTTSPAAAEVIDGGGRYAIPGLMELHAHTYRPDLLPGFLYFGITLVRDQGSAMAPLVAYGDAIAAGAIAGPRVAYGGFQFYSDYAWDDEQGRGIEPEADPAHVQRSVALAQAMGAQHIKTRTFRRWDINARMIEEAHRRGMRATGHCSLQLPLVAAGMDAKEHIGGCPRSGEMVEHDDLAQLARAAGIAVVPTIVYYALAVALNRQPDLLEQDRELAPFVPSRDHFRWMIDMPPRLRDAMARDAQRARETTARLARAGVTIGTGTDVWQIPAGVHMELAELVAAGLSPMDALRAATSSAARIVGLEHDLGTIQVGKWADLVLLDADPLADIHNTRRIAYVIEGGGVVDRAAILAKVRAAK